MIKEFINAWDARKRLLEEDLRRSDQGEFDYKVLVKKLFDVVINPFVDKTDVFNTERISVVDDGEWQGCQLFLLPRDHYQPSPYEYVMTYQSYGSCSGCDTLEGIRQYEEGYPDEEQVKEYMLLELHLLQRCRFLIDKDTYIEETD